MMRVGTDSDLNMPVGVSAYERAKVIGQESIH